MKLCGNKKEKNIGSKSILENSSGLKKKSFFRASLSNPGHYSAWSSESS